MNTFRRCLALVLLAAIVSTAGAEAGKESPKPTFQEWMAQDPARDVINIDLLIIPFYEADIVEIQWADIDASLKKPGTKNAAMSRLAGIYPEAEEIDRKFGKAAAEILKMPTLTRGEVNTILGQLNLKRSRLRSTINAMDAVLNPKNKG